jgi:hypothetical protein
MRTAASKPFQALLLAAGLAMAAAVFTTMAGANTIPARH